MIALDYLAPVEEISAASLVLWRKIGAIAVGDFPTPAVKGALRLACLLTEVALIAAGWSLANPLTTSLMSPNARAPGIKAPCNRWRASRACRAGPGPAS